ncbi:ALF repeat-containing protein [Streptomyces sp. NBC_00536]|uniref:ALF repeat-containing protein n=1 Tax=Streptomyces sp. NBC_00536 TaxID=2975769 RepID=UPI002E81D303|nr:ALF repeat-containing protein [Streptomyces sp. NBC_00536]WUC77792.1 ALF repeat-containing protein [Streptomyces sp. NBC_00536]
MLDGLSLDATADALKVEAERPDVDVKATAAKGRALVLKALKNTGPWSQSAAAAALGGTDQDVLDYLRTRWKKAGQDEIRGRVLELSGQSPYPSVRTAATDALKGSDQQLAEFYANGQYAVGTDDLAVRVSQINNTGGPSVKEASKAALANGSGKALAVFLANGQYAARQSDEEVTASKLVTTGGPEVKAAAKIALAGPADQLHEFVTVGQYMADRKDQLAENHINQVSRLIAETSVVAAKAEQNRWKAAEAAAKANQAAAEASNAAQEAQKSAEAAGKYATDAKNSANAAQASATKAANSAATARNAAAQADREADAAAESAAQAAFSAQYARTSAARADAASVTAREGAKAAGKSAEEANTLASEAWTEVQKKREVEVAEARRLAEEQRKRQQEATTRKPRACVPHPTREIAGLLPCALAGGDFVIEMPPIDPTMTKIVWEVTGLNDIKRCIQDPGLFDCSMAAVSVLPIGKLKLATKLDDGVEALVDVSHYSSFAAVSRDTKVLDELAAKGTKFSRENVVAAAKTADGKIVFLETGGPRAGLEHVMKHGDEFVDAGVAVKDIPEFIIKAVTEGKVVGQQRADLTRPIYEVTFQGKTQRVAVTTGDNGFSVGANMRSAGK